MSAVLGVAFVLAFVAGVAFGIAVAFVYLGELDAQVDELDELDRRVGERGVGGPA